MSDTALVPTLFENEAEARIRDLDLANDLQMARPANIRQLIAANREELEIFGPLHFRRAMVSLGSGASREVQECWLLEEQALCIAALSKTPRSKEVRRRLIQVFTAWRRGTLPPPPDQTGGFPIPKTMAQALRLAAEQAETIERQAAELEAAAPKVRLHDELIDANGAITIAEAAKCLAGKSAQWLYGRLREAGWFDKRPGIGNVARGWVTNQGFIVTRAVTLPNGRGIAQPMLTPKGLAALHYAIRDGERFLHRLPANKLLAPPGSA